MPLEPEVMLTQSRLSVAVQVQLLEEGVTVTLPVAAVEVKDWLVGEIV